jgi:hypothetical protein
MRGIFERYTEEARTAIFLARNEAGVLGSSVIEPEHLLLGLLKEDETLLYLLPEPVLRNEMLQLLQRCDRKAAESFDIPLSVLSKRALAYGAEEAERLDHKMIGPAHLTLGLLRLEGCPATDLLRQHGLESGSYRALLRKATAPPQSVLAETIQVAPWLRDTVAAIEKIVGQTRKHLKRYADVYGEQRISWKPWTRKQALGHLVDSAAAHHIWFACALTQTKLVVSAYPQDDWVSAQKYGNYVWQEIVDLWVSLNLLLIHVLAQIPDAKREMDCRIGLEDPIPLAELIDRYVKHCEETAASILA